MKPDEFRLSMEAFWDGLDLEAERTKDPQRALKRLQAMYESLEPNKQEAAQQVFSDWIEAGDGHRRFAALAMVDRFGMRPALPALRRLADGYEHSDGPLAPYEWAKVNRIIGRLAAG